MAFYLTIIKKRAERSAAAADIGTARRNDILHSNVNKAACLFVPQCFDRVHFGCFVGGVISEEDTNREGDKEGPDNALP